MAQQAKPFLGQIRDSLDSEAADHAESGWHEMSIDPGVDLGVQKTKALFLAPLILLLVLAGFVIQTEAAAYVEDVLDWKKPFFMMYVSHSSFMLPWLCQQAFTVVRNGPSTWRRTALRHLVQVRSITTSIEATSAVSYRKPSGLVTSWREAPLRYLLRAMAFLTAIMTVSGGAWFLAVSMTTPSDLTAIYNCSTFFAAALSVPILKDKLGISTIVAVAISIVGTLVIAYGDAAPTASESNETHMQFKLPTGGIRIIGNLIALVGAVALGLYEVLYKKIACPPKSTSASDSVTFAIATNALTGIYTLSILWMPLVLLHLTGIEPFVFPTGQVGLWLGVSVIWGSISMTSLLILVSLTNPIFSSVASLLAIFFVAIADWLLTSVVPSLATCAGGVMIMVAFGLLARTEVHNAQKH